MSMDKAIPGMVILMLSPLGFCSINILSAACASPCSVLPDIAELGKDGAAAGPEAIEGIILKPRIRIAQEHEGLWRELVTVQQLCRQLARACLHRIQIKRLVSFSIFILDNQPQEAAYAELVGRAQFAQVDGEQTPATHVEGLAGVLQAQLQMPAELVVDLGRI